MIIAKYMVLRGTKYHYQRRVPTDLAQEVGRRFWRQSLGTGDRVEAERRARILWARHEEEIERLRRPDPVEAAEAALPGLAPSLRRQIEADGGVRGLLQRASRDRRGLVFFSAAASLLESNPPDDEGPLALELHEEELAALRAVMARRVAERDRRAALLRKVGLGDDGGSAPAHDDPENPRLVRLLERWAEATHPSDEYLDKCRAYVRRFVEVNGDLSVKEVKRDHIAAFAEAIAGLPRSSRRAVRQASIAEAVRLRAAQSLPAVSTQTVRKHLDSLNALFNWATRQGIIEANPARGVGAPRRRQKFTDLERRKPFPRDELERLLAAVREAWADTDRFWIVMLALYQGMRLEEICQLDKADIRREKGAWMIDINDNGERKKLKNAASRRIIRNLTAGAARRLLQATGHLRR